MNTANTLWVLGHRVRPWQTDDAYGLIEVVSPPKVAGPPPHFHHHEREFFFVLAGQLDVMADGVWSSAQPGTFIELPPHTVHTFINNSERDAVWITGWRPKGFERFFRDFGIEPDRPDAQGLSSSGEVLRRVAEQCESYGMYIRG